MRNMHGSVVQVFSSSQTWHHATSLYSRQKGLTWSCVSVKPCQSSRTRTCLRPFSCSKGTSKLREGPPGTEGRKRRGGQRGGQRTTPPRTINPEHKTHRGAEISRLEKKTKPPKVYCECIAVCLRATWGPSVFKTLCLAGFSAGHG